MIKMISVQEAEKIILKSLKAFPSEVRPLTEAYGRILMEEIKADRDLPPFEKSLVDGIALSFEAFHKGEREFTIQGTQAAGTKPLKLRDRHGCIEIMTGAVLPTGCDCVIPVEKIEVNEGKVKILEGTEAHWMQFIHRKASDHKKGELILKKSSLLSAPRISIAASVGKSKLKVNSIPKIAVISTGDELVDVNKTANTYQVRTSNSYAVDAVLKSRGFNRNQIFHIRDDKKLLLKTIAGILKKFDVLILSGGVSMGKFDFVPQVLKELKVKVIFHKVKQKPGKPFWFGKNSANKLVFALPGNPVSTQICTYRYVIPALLTAAGLKNLPLERVTLGHDFEAKPDVTFFLPVKLNNQNGHTNAFASHYSGSSDFVALGQSDGFVEITMDQSREGTPVPFYRW